MLAAWYDRQGPAAEVLQVGKMADPEPGPGEVRVRLRLSGINPGDTKKRSAWQSNPMSYPRIIPHSDGAGVIEPSATAWTSTGSGNGYGPMAHSPTGHLAPQHI